jgi:hypothetical protein
VANDLFDTSDSPIVEHHFDAVRVGFAAGEDTRHDTGCQLAGALIMLLDDSDSDAGLDAGSRNGHKKRVSLCMITGKPASTSAEQRGSRLVLKID